MKNMHSEDSHQKIGPLMIDIEGTELNDQDKERLCHPLVGGLILFSRNFRDLEQLSNLSAQVRALRPHPFLITVDHEGGRVQRFRTGFTKIPPMATLGALWEQDQNLALERARQSGFVLAAELLASGVDFSFTPVLDLDYGTSSVIGDRAFHRQPDIVVSLASALIEGLRDAGMAACGKHFPGHGWVEADSHVAIPVDERGMEEMAEDIVPFSKLIRESGLEAIMPAHVIYPKTDSQPAGFSAKWIDCLRQEIGFDGMIFSDDLSMAGASVVGDILERANAAINAGCDMLLVCNAPQSVEQLLSSWQPTEHWDAKAAHQRLCALCPDTNDIEKNTWDKLKTDTTYHLAVTEIKALA